MRLSLYIKSFKPHSLEVISASHHMAHTHDSSRKESRINNILLHMDWWTLWNSCIYEMIHENDFEHEV